LESQKYSNIQYILWFNNFKKFCWNWVSSFLACFRKIWREWQEDTYWNSSSSVKKKSCNGRIARKKPFI